MAEQTQNDEVPTKVECSAAREPAVRLFIVAAILIGFGLWCIVDVHVNKKYEWKEDGNIGDVFTFYFNHGGAIAFPLMGLIPLGLGIVSLRKRLVADDEGIGYTCKEKISWDKVRSLDAAQLADKGILRLHYESDSGEKTLVLDSWKLQNFRSLVQLVEKKAPSDS